MPSGLPATGGGGGLVYALPALPRTLDPLAATSRSAQLVSRQVHEPLVSRERPPYGAGGAAAGLALSVRPAAGRTAWRVTLRAGIRFQDGSPFDAAAVRANARRWTETGAASELLPGLFAVDAPRPGEVRFLFARPRSGVRALLASPRLGIVSPQALAAHGGGRSAAVPLPPGSGTGPFELGRRSRGRVLLTRHDGWWGSPAGLGPALEAVEFLRVPSPLERLAALSEGQVQIAEPFSPQQAAALPPGPLVRTVPIVSGRSLAGLEASVRGYAAGPRAPALSAVWLTRVGG